MDSYGEGISGILHETSGAWYYKSNLGDGNFSIAQPVASKPSFSGLSNGILQLQDIEANGKKYIVSGDTALKGFFEQTAEGDWLPFKSFESSVNIDLRDPNVKFIDLNGDGMAELVVSQENIFTWFASKGTEGFDEARRSTPLRSTSPQHPPVFCGFIHFIQVTEFFLPGWCILAGEVAG